MPPPRLSAHFCALHLLLALLVVCACADVRVNVGGPAFPNTSFRADLEQYLVSPGTDVASVPSSAVKASGPWASVYSSHRWALNKNLQYSFPVPVGQYVIACLFAETYAPAFKKGVRVFNVIINGKTVKSNLDVFAVAGANKALYIRFPNIAPVNGKITLTIAFIPGKQNPMLSGVVIQGAKANQLIGNAGFSGNPGVASPSTPVPPTNPVGAPVTPKCSKGILGFSKSTGLAACCPSACKKCGGPGCGTIAPGHLCCISSINKNTGSCTSNAPPCVPGPPKPSTVPAKPKPATGAAPTCSEGILGYFKGSGLAACCPKACGKCGKKGCAKFAEGQLCCISTINSKAKSCAVSKPPCVPNASVVAPANPPAPPQNPTTSTSGASLSCPISGATKNTFRLNVAGGAFSSATMGADNLDYIASQGEGLVFSSSAMIISAKTGPAPWDSAFSSHRWTKGSALTYKIPVPNGSYTVKLLFAEIFFKAPGQRKFNVFINGAVKDNNLDVVKLAGYKVGLIRIYQSIRATDGFVTVTIIKSVENPMLSGIFIEGAGAGQKAVGGGCKSGFIKTSGEKVNSGFDHRSHAVPGGPYVATDFDKSGTASVQIDGTQSHSHYSDPGPPAVSGSIVAYKWTWTENVNGKLVKKTNNNKSGKFTAPFPLGTTALTLEVVDSTGDAAVDTAQVEVKGSTQNGAYCYYYNYGNTMLSKVPLKANLDSIPKPLYGGPQSTINFNKASDFGAFPFSGNSFAVRCMFFIEVAKAGAYSYSVKHSGPFKLYQSEKVLAQSGSKGTTNAPSTNLNAGLNIFQLVYFRPKNLTPQLVLSSEGKPLSPTILQHDSSSTLPVIIGMSKTSSAPTGGQNVQIYGSGFINGVAVKFGSEEASNLISSDAGTLQVTVPPGTGEIFVTVSTNAGVSNPFKFSYTLGNTLEQPVVFKQTTLKDVGGGEFKASFLSAITYGPDGRLYLGSFKSGTIHALSVSADYKVTTKCERSVGATRSVLGVAFSPFTNALKMYCTSNSLYWKDKNYFEFEKGWHNGKIEVIEFSKTNLEDKPGKPCAGTPSDVVTGLPVSNHDHGVNKLQFLPDGSLLISIGGFTNGGISVPGKKPVSGDAKDDLLGGVASNPFSAAIVRCPVNQVTNIKYNQYHTPEQAKVVSGGACKIHASGLRNSYGMTLHTNGNLYATDNGPNSNFGEFSVDCSGGKKASGNIPDKLFLVEKGKYHGHPNLNRKECVHYPPSAVKPIVGNLKSSSNGIIEYRSNTFGGDIKGNLYISMFAGQHSGQISELKLGANGGKTSPKFAQNFLGFSGLSIAEGPRGEFFMPRVYQSKVIIAYPQYATPAVTFMLGVHPKQGPSSGGTKVLISGHQFGTTPKASFAGKPCTNIQVIDDNSFTCLTPSMGKNQQVAVVVTGTTGASPSYGTDYWYF